MITLNLYDIGVYAIAHFTLIVFIRKIVEHDRNDINQ
jgi:hypothetical protein